MKVVRNVCLIICMLLVCSVSLGAGLPSPGNPLNWGQQYNEFFRVHCNEDGTLKTGVMIVSSGGDDTSVIQAANDAADGAPVYLVDASYNVSDLTIDNCTLTGLSQEGTTINVTGTISIGSQGFGEISGRLHRMTTQTAAAYANTVIKLVGRINRETLILDQIRITSDGRDDVTPSSIGLLLETLVSSAVTLDIASSTFGSIIVEGYETGVKFNANESGGGTAFINGLVFHSLKIFNSVDLMEMTQAGTSQIVQNIFVDLFLQGGADTETGLTMNGIVQKNTIRFAIDGTISGGSIIVNGTSTLNVFIGDGTITDTAGANTQLSGAEVIISQRTNTYGRSFSGKPVNQTTGDRYLLLAQKIADHAIVGTLIGRSNSTFTSGENSARVYVNILSDSTDNNRLYWEIDSQDVDVKIVELTFDGDVWIALDAVNFGASDSPLQRTVFNGQYTEEENQLTWVDAADISGVTAVSSDRKVTSANVLNGSVTYAAGAVTNNSFTAVAVTVTGAALGDFAVASFSADIDDVQMNAVVTAGNTVIVTFYNNTGGAKTPVGDVFVRVTRK